ncbi:MAG: AsmA family protein, partial [Bacteroidota bacterium]
MKKVIKPLLIVLASLIFLVILAISIALWFVFTPERISPVVQKQANELLTCETSIGKVELTFFRTFPRFGLKLENLLLVNPVQGATSDTLMNIGNMTGDIDIMALWRHNEVILSDFFLENGTLHAFIDSLGNTNFDVMVTDTTQVSSEEASDAMPEFIDLGKIAMNNVKILYNDHLYKIYTDIRGLDGYITGNML